MKKKYLQLYIPFYEDLTSKKLLGKNEPVIVFGLRGDNKDVFDGYKLNDNGNLVKLNYQITEEYAKKNEVWVFSYNERVGREGDFISVDPDELESLPLAFNGGLYITGFRIPDLGAVESWTSGRFEVACKVFGRKVGQVLDYYYGKIRRKELRNGKWYNRSVFVFNWDIDAHGPDVVVQWHELDGGQTVTQTVNFPATNTNPAASYSFQMKDDDDNLGHQLVSRNFIYTNPDHIYDTGLINWKMSLIF